MAMHGSLFCQLRVKRRGHDVGFLDENWLAQVLGKDFDAWADPVDDRSADEDHFHGRIRQLARTEKDVTGQLPPIRVAQYTHVQQTQRSLRRILHLGRQQNGTRTGPEDSFAFCGKFLHGLKQPFLLQKLQLGRALAPRQNQAIATLEVGNRAYFGGLCAEASQHCRVRRKIPLHRQYPDLHSILSIVRASRARRAVSVVTLAQHAAPAGRKTFKKAEQVTSRASTAGLSLPAAAHRSRAWLRPAPRKLPARTSGHRSAS